MKSLGLLVFPLVWPLAARAQPAPTPTPTPAPAPDQTPAPAAPAPDTSVNPAAPTGPRMSMQDAVARAMSLQPSLAASMANADAASARVEQARVTERPTVTGTATGSIQTHTPPATSSTTTVTPGGTGGFTAGRDPTYGVDLGARATWILWDFGRTRARVQSAQAAFDAARANVQIAGLDVRTNVENAYLQAVAERELVQVAVAAEQTAKRHLDEAHRFVAAGAQDPITEATAAATAASATAQRVQAEGNYRTAIAALRLAIGDPSMPDDVALDPGWPTAIAGEDQDRVALVQRAIEHRPELAAARFDIEAASAAVNAASYGRRPTLTAGAAFDWPVNNHATPDPLWTATLGLSIPIFDGGLTRAQTREAEANRAAAVANQRSEQLAVEHDVEAAWISIRSATATLASTETAVATAHQQLTLAEGRFAAGVGSAVELADAQNAVINAEGQRVSAEFQLATSRTALRRALGE
jgi:outer membrane protein